MYVEQSNTYIERIEFTFGGYNLSAEAYGYKDYDINIWPNNFFEISRNATDDSFNIYLEKDLKDESGNILDKQYLLSPFISANNKIQINDTNNRFITDQFKNKEKALIHNSYLKKMPFSKLSSLAIGNDRYWYHNNINLRRNLRMSMISLFPHKIAQSKKLTSNNQQTIVMKYLDSMSIKIRDPQKIHMSKNKSAGYNQKINRKLFNKDNLIIKKKFNTIYFVPAAIDRLKGNKVIASVSTNVGKDGIDYSDINIKTGSYKTPFGTFKTRFVPSKDIILPKGEIDTIGYIVIDDYSYYDYQTKKIKHSWSQDSIMGELVPYNFKGKYVSTLDISFNKVLSDMQLTITHDLDQKILDPIEGKIKLNYQKNNKKLKKYRFQIDVKNMKYIISLNKIEKIDIIAERHEKKKPKAKSNNY